uniref:ATP synthase F0 subunit 8 n=1 Tax=Valvaribifidum huananense TaxID=2932341 RepID=UPI001FF1D3FA|nr:ATP synthase F0 subunit 8 [Valvaribifidum huananense]UOG84818.1 ATP synthase F0 subunit 8 [Valvaribifidum huananense]
MPQMMPINWIFFFFFFICIFLIFNIINYYCLKKNIFMHKNIIQSYNKKIFNWKW